ncbi:NADP-dependent oxidoreductase [Thermomonospora umbrina]|uniref:NADPH:quinone reductase-like Zn-dependent oxidoreductase n=1 Tax=Thermomonospora umbrina TaxID=111806 RepID=A0A3D9T195_9ACTN|nr:NADP-dependent oxidoreductase [Thermomonospora umbrina]REE97591.1 NADPH:quinone reductase-like Zn-dependent oxidoreductase [Thermomonospora umbrina]
MRAVVVKSFGGPEALKVVDVAMPEPGAGQILVRVEGAAVNPVDLATRAGGMAEAGLMERRDVTGIGWDVAGRVEQVGPGVTGFAAGDRVIGMRDRLDLSLGAYAEFMVLDASAAAPAPEGLTAIEAATLPLAALTASQSLDLLGLAAGETLLVTGAAGAVGGFAVELAALRGLRVVAQAGGDAEELVRGLGAHAFVERSEALADRARDLVPGGVDGVLDAAVLGLPAFDAVRSRGAFVSVIGGTAPPPLRGVRVLDQWIAADGRTLAGLSDLVREGRLTTRVAATFPLEDAAHAHERFAKGGLRGRLVLTP